MQPASYFLQTLFMQPANQPLTKPALVSVAPGCQPCVPIFLNTTCHIAYAMTKGPDLKTNNVRMTNNLRPCPSECASSIREIYRKECMQCIHTIHKHSQALLVPYPQHAQLFDRVSHQHAQEANVPL